MAHGNLWVALGRPGCSVMWRGMAWAFEFSIASCANLCEAGPLIRSLVHAEGTRLGKTRILKHACMRARPSGGFCSLQGGKNLEEPHSQNTNKMAELT